MARHRITMQRDHPAHAAVGRDTLAELTLLASEQGLKKTLRLARASDRSKRKFWNAIDKTLTDHDDPDVAAALAIGPDIVKRGPAGDAVRRANNVHEIRVGPRRRFLGVWFDKGDTRFMYILDTAVKETLKKSDLDGVDAQSLNAFTNALLELLDGTFKLPSGDLGRDERPRVHAAGTDRLMRNPRHAADTEDKLKSLQALVVTQNGEIDLKTKGGRMQWAINPEDMSRLRWEDVALRGTSLRLRDRPSRPPSRSRQVAALADDAACPVAAVLAWRALASEQPELVFTLVDSTGRRDGRPIHPYNLRRIAATRLDSLGPDGAAATPGEALRLLAGAPSAVLRDRALLLVGFAGAFRRNELCGLRWADVRDDPDGAILRLRRSKTDPAGRGRDVGIPTGRSDLTCPVTALHAWRDRTQDQLGSAWHDMLPVLCRVGRAGRIGTAPITPEALTRIIIVRTQAAEVPGHWGGRSLRAGFISTAADLDIPLEQIARQSRHAGLDSLVRYIRAEDPFRRNAADWVGL